MGRREEKKISGLSHKEQEKLKRFSASNSLALSLNCAFVPLSNFSTTEEEMRKTLGQGVDCICIIFKLSCMCGIYHVIHVIMCVCVCVCVCVLYTGWRLEINLSPTSSKSLTIMLTWKFLFSSWFGLEFDSDFNWQNNTECASRDVW